LPWQKIIGQHSFLPIDGNYTDSSQARWLLDERAFLNHPKEQAGLPPVSSCEGLARSHVMVARISSRLLLKQSSVALYAQSG
jgi:hypothetical protein